MSSKKRYNVILELARTNGWKVGAEVGVFKGDTLRELLAYGLRMYAVDLWADLPVQDVEKDMNRGVTNYHKFPLAMYEQEVRKLVESYGNQCTILKMDTVAAAAYVPNKSLDFVFIDACHESDAVRADIKAWTPKLRASGMLMGHDANWPSVRRVIDVMCPRWTSGSDNVWYLRKEFVRL